MARTKPPPGYLTASVYPPMGASSTAVTSKDHGRPGNRRLVHAAPYQESHSLTQHDYTSSKRPYQPSVA